MKPIKLFVLGSSLLATLAVFSDWVKMEGDLPPIIKTAMPTSGMQNGGPLFMCLLALPLIAAGVGALKRFGRGLAVTSFVGAFLASLLGLAKYSDFSAATSEIAKLGATGTIGAATGYWIFLLFCFFTTAASLVGIVRPEPKLAGTPMPVPVGAA
jgi:hypothetical protein